MANQINSPQGFAGALLTNLGIKPSGENMRGLVAWINSEGGHWHNSAKYNPLNTTQHEPGYQTFQSVGAGSAPIGIYNSWDQGLKATTQALLNGRYGNILHALKHGSASDIASAVGQSPWGTSSALIDRVLGATPKQQVGGVGALTTRLAGTPRQTSAPAQGGALAGGVDKYAVLAQFLASQPGGQSNPLVKTGLLSMLSAQVASTVNQGNPSTRPTTQNVPHQIGAPTTGYVNPHPKGLIAPGRIDEGTDPTIAAGAPIVAVGNARVVNVSHNFYGTTPYLVYQLTDGPRKGQYIYESEYITPHVKPGDVVRAGQVVATGQGRAIEEGFAGGRAGAYLPLANKAQGGSYNEGDVTGPGTNWAKFTRSLGAHTGRGY